MGTGCSHHSVPSLSNTATRSSTGTGAEPSRPVAAATKRRIAALAGPSRQLDNAVVSMAPKLRAPIARASPEEDDRGRADGRPPRWCAPHRGREADAVDTRTWNAEGADMAET